MSDCKWVVIQYNGVWEANAFYPDSEIAFGDGWYGLFDALYHDDDDESNLYGEHVDKIIEVLNNGGGCFLSKHIGEIIVSIQDNDDFSNIPGVDYVKADLRAKGLI